MWTSFNYLADMADLQRFAAQVARSLKDHGIFILDTKNFPQDTDYKIYTKTLENTEVQITLLTVKKYAAACRTAVTSILYATSRPENGSFT